MYTIIKEKINQNSLYKKILSGSLWNLLGSSVSRISALIGMVIIGRLLGKDLFGQLSLIQSTLGVFGVFAGVGLGTTASRYIPRYLFEDSKKIGNLIAFLNIASLIFIFVAGIALHINSNYIAMKVFDNKEFSNFLNIGILLLAITAYREVQNGILIGFEKFNIVAKINMVEGATSILFCVGLTYYFQVLGAILGFVLSGLLSILIGFYNINNILSKYRLSLNYKKCLNEFRILIEFGFPIFTSQIVSIPALWYSMSILAKSNNGFENVGIYNAAYQWHGPLVFVPLMLVSSSLPILAKEWDSGNNESFNNLIKGLCKLVLIFSIPPVLIIIILSKIVMNLYGVEFEGGWLTLILLALAAPFHALSKITSTAILCMNSTITLFCSNLIWGLILVLGSRYLIKPYGSIGLALAFLTAYILLFIILACYLQLKYASQNFLGENR